MSSATGEVGFEADGKRYTLCFSVNAICELEDALDISFEEIRTFKKKTKLGRAMFWAAMTDNHPDLTLKDAGKIMAAVGDTRSSELVMQAFSLAFPQVGNVPLDGKAKPAGRRAPTGNQPSLSG
jgi:hypothetical protein